MSSASLTTTSYAILGLLAIKPWTTYELTQQMDRSLGRMWPRAQSKLYEEPKKLAAQGLARASKEKVGRRSRTVYAITPKGRRTLAEWLTEPGAGPALEFEQLLKIFFSEHGTKGDALATLSAAEEWARAQSSESLEIGRRYLAAEGPFPQREAQLALTARFLTDFYALVGEWAQWASGMVERWPDDGKPARPDHSVVEETVRRAARAAGEHF
jgi:PadR family transcriptional regulator AphA